MYTPRINGLFATPLLFLFFLGHVAAGEHAATLGVSVRVVAPHQPALAKALPLPLPGHLMQEDVRGRHYYFDGALQAARDYYDAEMRRRGYILRNTSASDAYSTEMRWERAGEVALLRMRSTPDLAPTRISLLVMAE
jgi:hypothetical protein